MNSTALLFGDARAWIERCDRIFDGKREDGSPSGMPADKEFAYQQMRQLAIELLSQLGAFGTLPSGTHEGGDGEEPDEGTERELLSGDEDECGAKALSEVSAGRGAGEGQR